MNTTGTILMAEDDEDDFMILRDAFQACAPRIGLERVRDGEELIERLRDGGRLPSLILLDLNMPRKDGREALKEIKQNPDWCYVPVVALTTSSMQSDIRHTYQLGITSFIRKPSGYAELLEVIRVFVRYWFEVSRLP